MAPAEKTLWGCRSNRLAVDSAVRRKSLARRVRVKSTGLTKILRRDRHRSKNRAMSSSCSCGAVCNDMLL
jgi:hypothetical protein